MNKRTRTRKPAGEPLAKRQAMLRVLADQVAAIIWTTDTAQKFTSAVGGGLAALGLEPGQLEGMSVSEYLGTTDKDHAALAGHDRALSGEPAAYELVWRGRTYSVHLEPIRDKKGGVEGVAGIALDISDRRREQEDLERSMALLRSTLDSTADGILVVDENSRILHYNRRFIEMWRIPDSVVASGDANETLAFVLDQIVDPGAFVTKTMDRYAHPSSESLDILQFKDGRIFERYSPGRRGAGDPVRARVWSFRDVTARLRADEERGRSLSLLEAALESTADGLLVVDLEGRIVTYNRKFVEMWKIPESIVASRDDEKSLAYVLDQLKAPDAFLRKVKDLYQHPESQSFDWLEFHDGRIFERYSQPQRVHGRIIGRVWSFRDVTDRARMEEILRRQARTFEHMFDGVLVTDLSGKIVDCNPGAEKMFGHTREGLLGKTPETILSPAEDRDLLSKMLEGMRRQGRWGGLVRFRRKDGVRGTCETVVVPHSDEYGRTRAAIFIHRDITDRTELERLLREYQGLDDTGYGRG
ncbi:MAG: PAS domain S-box protein [Acidobacteriota bacterium]